MFRTVAMSILVLAAAPASELMAAEVTDAPQPAATPQGQEAVRRARELVAQQLKAGDEAIEVKQVEPQTWNNSGMGCAKPGSMTLQVITEGYVVALVSQGHEYRVHVSGDKAFICDKPLVMRGDPKHSGNVRGLDVAIAQARSDLVKRLGIDASKVQVLGAQPYRWQNTSMDCPLADQPVLEMPVNGYKIQMQYSGRIYTYHTDLKAVRACPAIEAQ